MEASIAGSHSRRNRGRPSLEDAAALEQSLLDIALREFLAHGYGGTTMAQIVRKAGISKTTLYSRYPSKEDLFRALLGRQVERFATLASLTAPDGTPDLRAGLERYAARTLEIGLEPDMLAFNRLIHAEAHRFPNWAWQRRNAPGWASRRCAGSSPAASRPARRAAMIPKRWPKPSSSWCAAGTSTPCWPTARYPPQNAMPGWHAPFRPSLPDAGHLDSAVIKRPKVYQ